jgi:RHS repeat-associated protein
MDQKPNADQGPVDRTAARSQAAPAAPAGADGGDGQAPTLPGITLPKGGGAVRGIDEKLTVGLSTGTASLSVPLPLPPGRQGFGPDLSLEYDSGSGNGPFGLGWRVNVASITRKTSMGLPQYRDADHSDVFVLSGAEDLVPSLVAQGADWVADSAPDPSGQYTVTRYRPRVEGGFARIEMWRQNQTGDVHWRAVSKDNVTRLFGQDPSSRIYDPEDPSRVFSWLLDLSYDDRGNAMSVVYKGEDAGNVPSAIFEQSRSVTANRYVKTILYGNTTPYLPGTDQALPASWLFQVVFDYGEHDAANPRPTDSSTWPCRPDPFSTYRSRFEVRTYRLCRRVLVYHRFPDGQDASAALVRSMDLTYTTDAPADPTRPYYSLLSSVTERGYIASGTAAPTSKAWPPLSLSYSRLVVDDTVVTADADALANLPAGADNRTWRWFDLDGEGTQGILAQDDNAWYYKRNISAFEPDGTRLSARFEPLSLAATKPARGGGASSPQLVDMHADGRLCAVDFAPPFAGYSERDTDGAWLPHKPFPTAAVLDWASSNVRALDLDGDGLADVMLTEDDAFTWHPWLVGDGFGPGQRVVSPRDEDRGPALVLDEGDWSVFLADMSGDGLTDLVRVRNGEICYWPNIGYGHFGARVAMDQAPWFDSVDCFDARRVRLADIDGSGTTDLVYIGTRSVTIWFNQSGNSFTAPTPMTSFPETDDLSTVAALDLLGTGTSCLTWSSPLPGDSGRQLRYVELTGGVKPHLLIGVVNNMGTETTLAYAASTRFYVEDLLAGTPWVTRLAFPVHVVTQKTVNDRVSRTRQVCSYSYHHGYFESDEREFRGFARVDQTDTDYLPAASGLGSFTQVPSTQAGEFVLPPVLTRTWVHTGAYLNGTEIASALAAEYYSGDAQAGQLGPTWFVDLSTPEEMREASRALRGRPLRVETYGLDGSTLAANPYSVEEHRYRVRLLQPPNGPSYASVYASDLETLSCHYERDPADPRVGHDLILEVDDYGTVTKSASVGYPRRSAASPEQSATLVTYSEHDVINVVDQLDWYRLGVSSETRLYELTAVAPSTPGAHFDIDGLLAQATGATTIPFEEQPSGPAAQKRLCGRDRTVYRSNDLTASLPNGHLESLALVDRTYKLALTPGLLQGVYTAPAVLPTASAAATSAGGYVDLDGDGNLWAPSDRAFYSPAVMTGGIPSAPTPDAAYASSHFYLIQGQVDPFGGVGSVAWALDIAVVGQTDPVGNATSAVVNFRLLQPWLVTDANQNRTGARFDELGVVVASAAMGKALSGGADEGDHLDLSTDEAAPSDDPTVTFDYNVTDYGAWAGDPISDPDHPQPVRVHTRARVTHKDPHTAWVETYRYLDGSGQIVLSKAQAEAGSAPVRDALGNLVRDGSGHIEWAQSADRWVGTGQVVRDNKGNAVKSYEPFFDSSPAYTDETDLVQWGVTAITRYDPLSRTVRIDNPDGSFKSTEFDAWRRLEFDENDNVLTSAWYQANDTQPVGSDEHDAATKAAAASNTPLASDLDPLGQVFLAVADGVGGQFRTITTLDIQGRVLATVDAMNRTVLTTGYAVTGSELATASIDAGRRWLLPDVLGKPLLAWDSRDFLVRHSYDSAHRPLGIYVTPSGGSEVLAELIVYGEGQPSANLCGSIHQQRDGAGQTTTVLRDFKGNVLTTSRQVLQDYVDDVDWSSGPVLDPETFTFTSTYDALNRIVTTTSPDGTVTTPVFNPRNLLASATVDLRGSGVQTSVVTSVTYDAKQQRQSITYGNGVTTNYVYDPDTFRLTNLTTTRPGDSGPLQNLTYVYDPVGNITRVNDGALPTIFYRNQVVSANCDYTYDVIYRLVTATGREHLSQSQPSPTTWDDSAQVALPLPSDGQAMGNYTETYSHDLVGNFTSITHTAAGGSWTRSYSYGTSTSNQLTSTSVGATTETYTYDPNGNAMTMPQLTLLQWDWKNQIRATASQLVTAGTPEATYYRYDATGNRIVKATNSMRGTRLAERIYLGAYEIYREYDAQGHVTREVDSINVSDGSRRICLFETTVVDQSAPPAAPVTVSRYQLVNQLGSAVLELDVGAAILTYEEYYPYGSTSFQSGSGAAEVSLKRYRYIGKELDRENGLYYCGQRYHAPWIGRWLSPDPAGLVDGVNRYAYAKGNPISKSDPTGTQGNDPDPPPPAPTDPPPPAARFGPLDVTGLSTLHPSRSGRQIFVGASVPALGLTGRGVLSADPAQQPDPSGYGVEATGTFDLTGGPAGLLHLQLDTRLIGYSPSLPLVPNIVTPPNFVGTASVRGRASALGIPLARFRLTATADQPGQGSLALDASVLFGLGSVTGSGTYDPDKWSMAGRALLVAPPVAVAFGDWSIGSNQPLTANIHYFGFQAFALQLVPDLDPFIRERPPNYTASPGDQPDPSAFNQSATAPTGPLAAGITASPGPSMGYNYIQARGSDYSIFSVGIGLGGNNYYFNSFAFPSALYPVPLLDNILTGHDMSTPMGQYGWYAGINYTTTFRSP